MVAQKRGKVLTCQEGPGRWCPTTGRKRPSFANYEKRRDNQQQKEGKREIAAGGPQNIWNAKVHKIGYEGGRERSGTAKRVGENPSQRKDYAQALIEVARIEGGNGSKKGHASQKHHAKLSEIISFEQKVVRLQ